MGLLRAGEGDAKSAREWLRQARSRATRVSDPYEWVHGHVLDTLASLALEAGDPDAGEIVNGLKELAGRTGMRELAVRAHLHDARLGAEGALDAARLLGSEIDNPALEQLLRASVPA